MAVTIPNSTPYDGGFLASHSISAFGTSGSNPYLLLAGYNKNPASDISGNVTADGNTMTKIDENINANVVAVQLYGIIPGDTSQDIVIPTATFKEFAGVAINLNGVDQSTPYIGTPVKAQGFGTGATAAVTGTLGNLLMVIISTQNDRSFTPSNCNELQDFAATSGIGGCFVGYIDATGSSQTIGATVSSGDNWRLLIVEIKAAAAAAAGFVPRVTIT